MKHVAEVHQHEYHEVPLTQDRDSLLHERRHGDILGDSVLQLRSSLVVVRRRVQRCVRHEPDAEHGDDYACAQERRISRHVVGTDLYGLDM